MKKNIILALLSGALMLGSYATSHSQDYAPVPVTISTEKVKAADGTVCYSHIVRERQTLYSISKAYNVALEDIYKYNPKLEETGLKKNVIILIPIAEAPKQKTVVIEETVRKEESIVTEPIKENTIIEEKETIKEPVREPIIHVRKWTEDLDAIAEKYGVTVEALMKANDLKTRKLKRRQKLIIPVIEEVTQEDTVKQTVTPKVDSVQVTPTPQPEEEKKPIFLFPKSKVKVSMLLPLTNAEGQPSKIGMNFYCGALMAVRDLGLEGINTELTVHDITAAGISADMVKGSDVVIGPISTGDISRLLAYSGDRQIISPLDMRAETLVGGHPNLTQTRTPTRYQYIDLVNWVAEDMAPQDSVILISEKSGKINRIASQMRASLDSTGIKYSTFSYSILEGRDVTEPLTALTSQQGTTRVLVASDSEAFVNDVVRNINLLIYNNIPLVIYAPGKTRSFETIEVDHFHKSTMHLSIADYIDYNDAKVKEFIKKYRALYNAEPDSFAFQGYDVTSYFIALCQKYGNDWPEMLEKSDKEMLQGTFRFVKEGEGGYINTATRRIVFESGYSVSKVR